VLKKPLCINYEHEILLKDYTSTVLSTVKNCSNKSRYTDFLDIANLIIEHHNEYKKGIGPANLYDFLSIIPTNLSVAVQGFLAGIENKRNMITIRAYRFMLTNTAYKLVEDLDKIKLDND